MNLEPVVKWSGSKRSQAIEILKYFPKQFDTYYEPFVGSASVLFALLHSDINVNHYICADINNDLINLYNLIKHSPDSVSAHYKQLWQELNVDNDIDRKRDYFNNVRDRLNKQHDPKDFMFIMRTTTNGMPRYNDDGNFNNSFHLTRNGIVPESLADIVSYWSFILNKYGVEFLHCSYNEHNPNSGDFLYLDPPYANTTGMYFGDFNVDDFFNYLRTVNCSYALSFDGIVKSETDTTDMTYNVPKDIYDSHVYIRNGNSSFRRTIGKSNDSIVYESLYLKGNFHKVYKRKNLF